MYPNPYVLELEPILVPKIWGGYSLVEMLGQQCEDRIGESWTLSAYPGRSSRILNGWLAGKTLFDAQDVLTAWGIASPFPILIKFLETRDSLSLQVHPNDELAKELTGYDLGKTEAWYILRAAPDAVVWLGLADGVEADNFMAAPSVKLMKSYVPTPGVTFPVPAGTPHATSGSILFAEVQQNSDITYRIDDFGRGRELHLENAAKALSAKSKEPILGVGPSNDDYLPASSNLAWLCPQFTMLTMDVDPHSGVYIVQSAFETLTVLEGEVVLCSNGDVRELYPGRSVLIPQGLPVSLHSVGSGAKLLRVR